MIMDRVAVQRHSRQCTRFRPRPHLRPFFPFEAILSVAMVLEEEMDCLLHPIQGNDPLGRGLGQHIDVPALFVAEEVLHEVVFENDVVRLSRFIGG